MNNLQPQQQLSPDQIEGHHQNLDDFQSELKNLIKLPDSELNLSKIYGAASDLVTKHKLSNGKRGSSALDVVAQLASPDFPKQGPNGEPPATKDIRKYLLKHFNQATQVQAMMTQKFGPPMQQDQ